MCINISTNNKFFPFFFRNRLRTDDVYYPYNSRFLCLQIGMKRTLRVFLGWLGSNTSERVSECTYNSQQKAFTCFYFRQLSISIVTMASVVNIPYLRRINISSKKLPTEDIYNTTISFSHHVELEAKHFKRIKMAKHPEDYAF